PGATTTHATAGAARRLAQTSCATARLGDADERVADGAELVLHARAPAPLGVAALERPPRHDVRVGGGAAIGAAAIPDHLHVLGVGEGLAEVAVQVGAVARDDEDLTRHLRVTVSPLQIVGHPGGGTERPRVHRVDGGPGAGPDVRAVGLAAADDQARQLAAVALEQDDLQRRRVEPGAVVGSPPVGRARTRGRAEAGWRREPGARAAVRTGSGVRASTWSAGSAGGAVIVQAPFSRASVTAPFGLSTSMRVILSRS